MEARAQVAGTHHPDGVFLAYGPGISRGAKVARRKIADVAATLLYSVGLDVPADFEGVVPKAMFTTEHLHEHPVVEGAPTTGASTGSQTAGMAPEEKEQIMAQLQMLGYME